MPRRDTKNTLRLLSAVAITVVSFGITLWLLEFWEQREHIVQTVLLKSPARAKVTSAISTDVDKASFTDGHSLMSTTFVPINADSTIRIHVRTYVRSEMLSPVVMAFFRKGEQKAIWVAVSQLDRPRTEEMVVLTQMPSNGTAPVGIEVRIGPAEGGTIEVNTGLTSQEITVVIIHEIKNARTLAN